MYIYVCNIYLENTVDLSRLNTLRRPIRKSDGGGQGKSKNKIMQERVTKKHVAQRRSEGKKVLQSTYKLHCRVYKLYPLERQLGSHFILQFNFLILVESHSPDFLCNSENGHFSLSRLIKNVRIRLIMDNFS